jgi:phenylpyruvate tautomerase PptA (4-oxalocrotonate tautomerase family)
VRESADPHPAEEAAMPLIEVKLFDFRVDEETSARLIEKMTDAMCEATGVEGLRDHTWVIVEGHSPKQWGVGGRPWPVEMTPPAAS